MFRRVTGAIGRTSWRLTRKGEGESADAALQKDAEEIDFQPLDPVAIRSGECRSFDLITEEWLRKGCDPVLCELAERYVAQQRVTILHAHGTRIHATTRGASLYEQELIFQEGRVVGRCTCVDAAHSLSAGGSLLLCRHGLAVLLFQAAANRTQMTVQQEACLCPVTRQELKPGDRIFQCQACHTAYSEAGWEFVRRANRGRCCTCSQARTIHPRQ